MTIQVQDRDFKRLIGNQKRFDIPYFQRTYSWGAPQLDKFCNDLASLKISNSNRKTKSTFIGSMLITDEVDAQNYMTTKILDGQQRFTTAVLFVLALSKKGYDLYETIVNSNPDQIENRPEDVQYREQRRSPKDLKIDIDGYMETVFPYNSSRNGNNFLLSPSASDRSQWNKILSEDFIENFFSNSELPYRVDLFRDGSEDLNTQNLISAWEIIQNLIEKKFFGSTLMSDRHREVDDLISTHRLIELLLTKFQLAVIQVDPDEDEIDDVFISLNSEGMELSALDHIRSLIWRGLDNSDASNFLNKFNKFEKKLTAPFVNMLGSASQVGKKRSSHIKNFWFPYGKTFTNLRGDGKRQARDLDKAWSTLFGTLRGYDRSRKILNHMEFYVEIYNLVTMNHVDGDSNLSRNHPRLVEKLRNMRYWDPASACFPYIFQASKFYAKEANDQQKGDIEKSFDIIESFIMRRYLSITGETIKETLHSLFKKVKDYNFDFKMVRVFIEDERIKFIPNNEIQECFSEKVYSNTSKGMRYLLMCYENKNCNTDNEILANFNEWDAANRYDVDHFMPKNAPFTDWWKSHLKEANWDHLFSTDEEGDEIFNKSKYLDECGNIGNLMLLSSSANRQKGDKSFEESKEIIDNQLLSVTKQFINGLDNWKKEDMKNRQEDICNYFIEKWPLYEDEKLYGEEKINERTQQEDNQNAEDSAELREKLNQLTTPILWEYSHHNGYQIIPDDLKTMLRNNDLLADTNVTRVRYHIWNSSEVIPADFRQRKERNRYEFNLETNLADYFDNGTRLCWFWERYDVLNLNIIDLEDELAWQELLDHISPEEDV